MTDNERVYLLNQIATSRSVDHRQAVKDLGYSRAYEVRNLVKQLQDEGYLAEYDFALSGINKDVIGINYFTGYITEKGKGLLEHD